MAGRPIGNGAAEGIGLACMFQTTTNCSSWLLFVGLGCKSDACFDACENNAYGSGRSNKRIRGGGDVIGRTGPSVYKSSLACRVKER
jgi:hypothetical protein